MRYQQTRTLLSLIKLLILLCILIVPANADTSSATDGSTPLGLQPGASAGSYPLSGFDNVNLFNGNLSFQLALLSISGRGSVGMPVLLPIEGKWRVLDIALPQPDGSFNHLYMPIQEWWENNDRKYRPGSLVGRQGSFDVMTCPDNTTISVITLRRLTFTAPDGTEYELRDQATGGQPANNQLCNYLNPPSRGKVFVTADGSAATFVSETTIYDYVISPNPEAEFYPTGYLMLRDGTRFRINGGRVDWMRDRNGNKLTFSYDSNNRVQTITDSLNRVVSITRNTGPGTFDQITHKGFGGATRVIKVHYAALVNALRSDYPSTLTYKALFPELNGSNTTHHNPSVVSAITLPNNQQYQIKYNPYGEIARVVLPTGGAVEYDYVGGVSTGYEGSWVVYRRVVERRVYPDGATGAAFASRMTYSSTEAECAGCVKVDQLNNFGTLLTRTKHYFYGNAAMSFWLGPTEYPSWKEGKEYQTEVFASDGTTLLRRIVHTWQQPIAGNSWPLTQAETSDTVKSNNPQITQTVTTLEPSQANKVSKQTFAYDKYTNRTDVYEYDFGTGAAGSLVRRTHTDYLTSSYDTLNPDALNPDVSLTSHIRNLPTQLSVFDAAGVERARAGTEYDNYTLDGADCLRSFHCLLQIRANISGLDSQFSSSYTKRGNVTAVTRYLLTNGTVTGSISAYSQYDVAGNVVRILDPRSTLSNNIAINIEYDDRFGIPNDNEARSNSAPGELSANQSFAFPTRVTNALGQIIYAQFDYYIGKPVNAEDANGVIASGYFNDPLDRPKQIRRAVVTGVENQTTFGYDDVQRIVTTSSDRDANGDNLLVSDVRYDQMGRPIETRQYEGNSTKYIAKRTEYDALGRAFRTSNPFRPWLGESAIWTTQAFDALDRVKTVTTPDNAVIATDYDGDRVLVTDQTGKQRISRTNALGQLKDVWEITAADGATEAISFPFHPEVTAGYHTSYNYDALDNLAKVTQGSQQRFFMYDSLKRLLRARNPEQDTHTSLNLSDPITGNSTWSSAYQYDASGNLLVKTDAREVSSHFEYDHLNRLTRRWYNRSSSVSATTHNDLPLPTNVGATDEVKLYYDLQTLPAGAPSYTRGSSSGRLVAQTYGAGSNGDYFAYDVLGRATLKFQQTGTVNYQMSAAYNLAGAISTLIYPSNRSVTNSYDQAGRLSSVGGNLGDGITRTYASGIVYSSFGGLVKEQFGTTIPVYNKLFYNSRGQLAEIRVSTSNVGPTDQPPTDTTWNRGAIINHYSEQCWGMCGGSNSASAMTDNNGNLRKQEVYIPNDDQVSGYAMRWQQYDYDSLNRLNWVREIKDGAEQWKQQFTYDRWGNRTINTGVTYGTGINNKAFSVNTANNRLGVPSGQSGVMSYDAVGNLINDTYTGAGNRTYDGENKITSAWGGNNQEQLYRYDATGQRIKRTVSGVETWQVYGFGGDLVAEYAANGAAASPRKEYCYKNGQVLVTASVPRMNVAAAANGGTATASQTHSAPYAPSGAINGDRKLYLNNNAWSNSNATFPQWLQVDFNGSKTIDEIDVFSVQDNYSAPSEPTPTMTFNAYGLTAFQAQYWNGSTWVTVPGGNVMGNNKVWKQITFAPITTSKIRIWITGSSDGYSRMTEVEAWGVPSGSSAASVQWLVSDQLGTPRMIIDQTGSLANVRRHDYLPFGEELFMPVGGRSAAQGYTPGDSVRQQFTAKERDVETGLDYFGARCYASVQGRFTAIDPTMESISGTNPQSWNRYAYVFNNPLRYIDPLGLWAFSIEYEYYEDGEKKGQVKSAKLVFTKTSEKDDATSLLKQLGYNPGDKGFDKLLKQVSAALGEADSVQSSKLGGEIGSFFGVIEDKLRDQKEYERRNPTATNGPPDPDYQDCSMTACRLAYPGLMALRGAGGVGNQNFGIDEADAMNGQRPRPPLDALRVRDIIRYGRDARRHFANVIFIGEDGVASIFSRSGVRGRFETLKINNRDLIREYGPITGSFRP